MHATTINPTVFRRILPLFAVALALVVLTAGYVTLASGAPPTAPAPPQVEPTIVVPANTSPADQDDPRTCYTCSG